MSHEDTLLMIQSIYAVATAVKFVVASILVLPFIFAFVDYLRD